MHISYFTLLAALSLGATAIPTAPDPTACPENPTGDYDYIVVGSGAGGGPLAARLAISGYKVLVIDAGHDVVNINTTIPLYNARAVEDPETALDYSVNLYGSGEQVTNWYPRASGLGGSTIHNALLNILQTDYEFDALAELTNDDSWSSSNMRNYFKNIEKNAYLAKDIGIATGHGYDGWMQTDSAPSNLLTDPKYHDPQLEDIAGAVESMVPLLPNGDFNAEGSDGKTGGGQLVLTKDQYHNRSTIRDHLANTHAKLPTRLNLLLDTMVTKVLTCTNSAGSPQAYGVSYASGPALLPIARRFKGKQTLSTKTVTAKYEVIVSAGVYQTPQLLMLSGIGDKTELAKFGIPTIADVPGVGQNLMDRMEISVNWKLKQDHVVFKGCKFGSDPSADPCLKDWQTDGHTNLYASGPGFFGTIAKSNPSLPYIDVFNIWSPALFHGYIHGFPEVLAANPDFFSAVILKARTRSRGWVKLTSADPQDVLDINKNLYATPEGLNDLHVLREAVKNARSAVAAQANITSHILEEAIPGPSVSSDADIEAYIRKSAWGHHACCTAKIGAPSDPMAVLDGDFNVRGVQNLRVVDLSIFPDIPGLFVTTPIYMMSEKAADVVLQTAQANNWAPTD